MLLFLAGGEVAQAPTEGDRSSAPPSSQSAYNGEEENYNDYGDEEEEEEEYEEGDEEEEEYEEGEEEEGSDFEDFIYVNSEFEPTPIASEESTTAREKRHEELVEKHKELLERRRKQGDLNVQLQNKLAEYFRRKRADAAENAHSNVDSVASSAIDTSVDYNARFTKYMATLTEVREKYVSEKAYLDWEIESLRKTSQEKKEEAEKKNRELLDFIQVQSKRAISYKTGRALPVEQYQSLLEMMERKSELVTSVRLENLKLQRQVDKINAIFKALDLSEGLHLIDFEQLKIENQTYNEKIEERNEETGKLRRKIISTVQILTHCKEKLHACQSENTQFREQLKLSNTKFNRSRDILTKLKQSRDALKADLSKLQRASGLLSRPEMLRGYENSVDEVEARRQKIAEYTRQVNECLERSNRFDDKMDVMKQKIKLYYPSAL